jgi:ribonuclease J
MPNITIHRGTHQIGGCVTEISTERARVFIDFGSDLPGVTALTEPSPVDGLTFGDRSNSALFLTHYHGDHIGRVGEVLPGVPVYIGATAKELQQKLAERMRSPDLGKIAEMLTYSALDRIEIGDITVTPLMIDHSAFDAYMFVIDAGGKRILHTGDFRAHGFRGGKTFDMLRRYAPGTDYIICENTTLSRSAEPAISERELQTKARGIMAENKYVFVLCASTNIDRIGAFYHANPKGRLFICDRYQKSLLEIVRGRHADKSVFYDFKRVYDYAPNLNGLMEDKGFCMLIRQGAFFGNMLNRYKGRSKILYSMWTGYLKGDAKNERLVDFLSGYEFEVLHTSGHANPDDLKKLYEAVNPKAGLIPIHGEAPDRFRKLLPDGNVIVLEDGEAITI